MNTKHLVYFLEIVRQKNMNRAAEALFVSQSSLSQYLSRLEQELGTSLFHRQKGNMTLTQSGRIYQDYAKAVLQMEETMLQKIHSISASAPIRVGVNSIWSNTLIASITSAFHRRYPDTTIELFDENHKKLKKAIQEGTIDLALISTDSLEHLTGYQKILRMEEIVFAVSSQNLVLQTYPDLPETLTFPQLMQYFAEESYILNKANSSFRPLINSVFADHSFHPVVICEVSNMTTIRDMIRHNIGVSFIPASIMDGTPDITCFSLSPKLLRINGLICRNTLAFTEEEQYLIDLIEQHPLFQPSV